MEPSSADDGDACDGSGYCVCAGGAAAAAATAAARTGQPRRRQSDEGRSGDALEQAGSTALALSYPT